MIINLKTVAGSTRSAHKTVVVDDEDAGEIWREQVQVVVSKITEPRRMDLKWRWFARRQGSTETLGRGTRAAMLFGPGFKTKDVALEALTEKPSQA